MSWNILKQFHPIGCLYFTNNLKSKTLPPDQCGSGGWSVAHRLKGCGCDNQSGHTSKLWVRCPGGACRRKQLVDVCLSVFLPLSLKNNEKNCPRVRIKKKSETLPFTPFKVERWPSDFYLMLHLCLVMVQKCSFNHDMENCFWMPDIICCSRLFANCEINFSLYQHFLSCFIDLAFPHNSLSKGLALVIVCKELSNPNFLINKCGEN